MLIRLVGLPVVDVGLFRAVFNIVGLGSFVAIVLNVVVFPYVSELESKGEADRLKYFCSLVIKFLVLVGTPASIGFFLLAKPVLEALLPSVPRCTSHNEDPIPNALVPPNILGLQHHAHGSGSAKACHVHQPHHRSVSNWSRRSLSNPSRG